MKKQLYMLVLSACLVQTVNGAQKMPRTRYADLQRSFNQLMDRETLDGRAEESACTILTTIASNPIYNEVVNKILVKDWVNDAVNRLSIKLNRAPVCAPELETKGIIIPTKAAIAPSAPAAPIIPLVPSAPAEPTAPAEITVPIKTTVPSAPLIPEPPMPIEIKEQPELPAGEKGVVKKPGELPGEAIRRETTKEPTIGKTEIQIPKPKAPSRVAPKPVKIEEGRVVPSEEGIGILSPETVEKIQQGRTEEPMIGQIIEKGEFPAAEKGALVEPKTTEEIKRIRLEEPSMGQIVEQREQAQLPAGEKGVVKPGELPSEAIRRETKQPTIEEAEIKIPIYQGQVPAAEKGTLSPETTGKIQPGRTEEPTIGQIIEKGEFPTGEKSTLVSAKTAEEMQKRMTEQPKVERASKAGFDEKKATLQERIDYLATMAQDSKDVEKLASKYGLTNSDGSANTVALIETLENFEQQIKDDARAISSEKVVETEKTIKPYLATIRSNIDTYEKGHGQVSTELMSDINEHLNALARMVNESNNMLTMAEKYGAIQNGKVDTDLLLTNLDETKKSILDAAAKQSPVMRAQIETKIDEQLQTIRDNILKYKNARIPEGPTPIPEAPSFIPEAPALEEKPQEIESKRKAQPSKPSTTEEARKRLKPVVVEKDKATIEAIASVKAQKKKPLDLDEVMQEKIIKFYTDKGSLSSLPAEDKKILETLLSNKAKRLSGAALTEINFQLQQLRLKEHLIPKMQEKEESKDGDWSTT